MNCVFIGSDFYINSRTMMSSVYEIKPDGYQRTDWGFIQLHLDDGGEVHIRQATNSEKEMFLSTLKGLNE